MAYPRQYIVLAIIVAISGSLLYFLFDPTVSNLFPKCIFHSLTNLDCPGCGSQRSIHALLNGNIIEAANFNLLVVLFLPLLAYSAVATIANTFFHQQWAQKIFYSIIFVRIVLVVVISFWILRNIPYAPLRWLSASN